MNWRCKCYQLFPKSTQTQNRCFLHAFIFLLSVHAIHSIALVVAHERLLNWPYYPPLPDTLHRLLPHWQPAFRITECILLLYMVIFIVICLSRDKVMITLSRLCIIFGCAFILRSITISCTTLSHSSKELYNYCTSIQFSSNVDRIWRAVQIWLTMGSSIQGFHTCLDYVFSGHGTALTLMNLFIVKYRPNAMWAWLPYATWLANFIGLLCIIIAREHYTIDVLIAFYVSVTVFWGYHWILEQRDNQPAVNGRSHKHVLHRIIGLFEPTIF